MKTSQVAGAIGAIITFLVIGAFARTAYFLRANSRRDVSELVSQIKPGTSFSAVVSRLGREMQISTNAVVLDDDESPEEPLPHTNQVLHVFLHRSMLWPHLVYVYTDSSSVTVIKASWGPIGEVGKDQQ
jgi:hypothetical protein